MSVIRYSCCFEPLGSYYSVSGRLCNDMRLGGIVLD